MGGLKLQRAIGTNCYQVYSSNGSRRKILIMTSVRSGNAGLCESKKVVYVPIKAKGLGQRFEKRRRGRPADVFNIIMQKRPNTVVVHLKIDEAMESRRSYSEVASGLVENLPYCLYCKSGLSILLARRLLSSPLLITVNCSGPRAT